MRLFAIIASGSSLSDSVDITKYGPLAAIFVPTITSGDMLLRGSFDPTSANFVRAQKPLPNTGDARFATGVGSLLCTWPAGEFLPPYVKLETSVAQTDNRTFVLLTKP